MQKVFNADILMENPDNCVRDEHITNIIPNNPYYVVHSIYFAQSLTVFEDAARKKRLVLNVDYEYASIDSVASELSNKDCYRAIIFLKTVSQAYIDYHSYGDLVSADMLNRISENTEQVKEQSDILSKKVTDLTNELAAHQKDTAPHGAQESVYPKALALRSEAGTLKAADATDEQELTTLGQINKTITETKNDVQTRIQKAKEEALDTIDKNIKALIDNAPEDLNTLKKLATRASQNKQDIETLKAIRENHMPLNPVCAYDMADIALDETPLFTLPAPIVQKKEAKIYGNSAMPLKTNTRYHISITSKWTGDARPYLMVFRSEGKESPWGADINGTQEFYVEIPSSGVFYLGVWMHGSESYKVQPADSVTIEKLTITEVKAATVIDSSGNMQQSILTGTFEKTEDASVGSVIHFKGGCAQSTPIPCMDIGKQWSHSRWVKINTTQPKNSFNHIWDYSKFDCGYFLTDEDGNIQSFYVTTSLRYVPYVSFSISPEKLPKNEWLNIVTMTDMQATYCRKIVYINKEKVIDRIIKEKFSKELQNYGVNYDMAESPYVKTVKGALANLLFFDRLLTEAEVQWLGSNSYYPVKRYSLAEYKADKNRALLETLQQELKTLVPKSAFNLTGSTLSMQL